MPYYKFLNKDTNEEFIEFMTISSFEQFMKENTNIVHLVHGAPLIHSGRGMKKPEDGFRDVLREIKKAHSKGITKSTINTF